MKKFQTTALGIAALLGLGGAFAFKAPHKPVSNFVYATPGSGVLYSYSNTVPVNGLGQNLICQTNSSTACTISTTGTAAWFNANKANSFPTVQSHSGTIPAVTTLLDQGKIYK